MTADSTPSYEPQWKRAGFRSQEEARIVFWDNLSKVPLCPPALKEFDRRNSLAASPAPTPAASVSRLDSPRDATALKRYIPQLKRFARRGGPDLRDLRGYRGFAETPSPPGTMPPRKTPYRTPSSSRKSTTKARRISAYNPGFGQHLINHGVYPDGYEYLDGRTSVRPENWEEIQQAMMQPRPSLSSSQFSDGTFDDFERRGNRAVNESEVMTNVFPTVRGEADIPSAIQRPFENLAPLTDGSLCDAKPDYYYGARPEQLHPRIMEDLNHYVVPTTNQSGPVLPNHFTEGKGPAGSRAVAGRQALYDGALGARAMQHLQSYGQPEPVYDNNAYTITTTFDGHLLEMYTVHPTQPANPDGQPEYHTHKLKRWAVSSDPDTFRHGATAYRNARDWATEKRSDFIDEANGRATSQGGDRCFDPSGDSEASTYRTTGESETSTDELALENESRVHGVRRGESERNDRSRGTGRSMQ